MFKINNKVTTMTSITSFLCHYYQFWTYFTAFCSVSITGFEQVNVFLERNVSESTVDSSSIKMLF